MNQIPIKGRFQILILLNNIIIYLVMSNVYFPLIDKILYYYIRSIYK